MDTILPSGKKIGDLKVSQLKKELAKRRFSTIGKKSELAERLIQVGKDIYTANSKYCLNI